MLRRLLAATAGAALLLGSAPAARALPAVLTLTADHAASGSFTLPAPTRVRLGDARISGSGSIAGFALFTSRGVAVGHAYAVDPQLPATSSPRVTFVGEAPKVTSPPGSQELLLQGRYVVYALGDGGVSVTLPLLDGASIHVNATRPITAHATARTVFVTAGSTGASTSVPAVLRPRGRYVILGVLDQAVAAGSTIVSACASGQTVGCGAGRHLTRVTAADGVAGGTILAGMSFAGRELRAGTWLVNAQVTTTLAASGSLTVAELDYDPPTLT